jgi:malate dehydrogenase
MIIWGNHSSTQYPDISHCLVEGPAAAIAVERSLGRGTFIPAVQQRGAAVIKARGASSAASAASAAIDHVHDWIRAAPSGDWVSMAVPSDGSYGIAEGVIYSYPVTARMATITSSRGWRLTHSAARAWMPVMPSSSRSATVCVIFWADQRPGGSAGCVE